MKALTQKNNSYLKWSNEQQSFIKLLKQTRLISSWKNIAFQLNSTFPQNNRSGKQCRERYMNFIRFGERPVGIINWTTKMDEQLFKKISLYGQKWTKISIQMQNRSQNCLKNRFYGILRKMTRSINKMEKKLKRKNRKLIRFQIIVRILKQVNQIKCFQLQEIGNMQIKKYMLQLSETIINKICRLSNDSVSQQQIVDLIDRIHQYMSTIKNKVSKLIKDKGQTNQILTEKVDQLGQMIIQSFPKIKQIQQQQENHECFMLSQGQCQELFDFNFRKGLNNQDLLIDYNQIIQTPSLPQSISLLY